MGKGFSRTFCKKKFFSQKSFDSRLFFWIIYDYFRLVENCVGGKSRIPMCLYRSSLITKGQPQVILIGKSSLLETFNFHENKFLSDIRSFLTKQKSFLCEKATSLPGHAKSSSPQRFICMVPLKIIMRQGKSEYDVFDKIEK